MAPEAGRARAELIDELLAEPRRFGFFQAVLLLERRARRRRGPARRRPVGGVETPAREVVRLRAAPSLTHPSAEVAAARPSGDGPDDPPPELSVAVLGLVGASGALPHHYTTHLLRRVRDKDLALRDFLDIFHHRLLSLFYRAWGKYRLPLAYERARAEPGSDDDPAARALFCLAGLGPEALRGRLDVADEVVLHYAGHFAHHPRSAAALEAVLADYFALPIRVVQMVGQWLHLDPADRSRLAPGGNNHLGEVVLGRRVWDAQGKLRLRVGPLSHAEFRQLMPDGNALRPLGQLARAYAGPELDIDVQPVLRGPEVPWCRLDASAPDRPRLGWNTWVRRQPFEADTTGPTFSLRPDEEALTITPRSIFSA